MHSLGSFGVSIALATLLAACGGARAKPEAAPSGAPAVLASDAGAAATEPTDAGAASKTSAMDAGTANADASAPDAMAKGADRPFAATSLEATHLIDEAVEHRRKEMEKCVISARERRKTPNAEVVIELGIDQEGSLIGVKAPKGAPKDRALLDCVRDSLAGAPFPRSTSGVITLKKRFTQQVVHPVHKAE